MTSVVEDLRNEIKKLAAEGELLLYRIAFETGSMDNASEEKVSSSDSKILKEQFSENYHTWYSKSLKAIATILPERLDDFIQQYKDPKRKRITYGTYVIDDYLMNLRVSPSYGNEVDGSAAVLKMKNQSQIVKACFEVCGSKLKDISSIVSADLFDSEVAAAEELAQKGFFRASGAISGVVLEKHLSSIADNHGFSTRKKNPSISDFNDFLKSANVIDVPGWRRIQHLADLRNLCDHPKEREPTKEDALELAEGVRRTLKNVF